MAWRQPVVPVAVCIQFPSCIFVTFSYSLLKSVETKSFVSPETGVLLAVTVLRLSGWKYGKVEALW
jgi:hypothetical protein